jgi:hypothetical protein
MLSPMMMLSSRWRDKTSIAGLLIHGRPNLLRHCGAPLPSSATCLSRCPHAVGPRGLWGQPQQGTGPTRSRGRRPGQRPVIVCQNLLTIGVYEDRHGCKIAPPANPFLPSIFPDAARIYRLFRGLRRCKPNVPRRKFGARASGVGTERRGTVDVTNPPRADAGTPCASTTCPER